MKALECARSCGLTFDTRRDYLAHLATCPRVLPGVTTAATRLARKSEPPAPKAKSRGKRPPLSPDLYDVPRP